MRTRTPIVGNLTPSRRRRGDAELEKRERLRAGAAARSPARWTAQDGSERLIWMLGLGALGLAWPTATIAPMAIAVALVASAPTLAATAALLFVFCFATYVYEPPWRGLYADLLRPEVAGRAQSTAHVMRGIAMAGALVGGGLALAVWQPLPFVIAANTSATACSIVAIRVREPRTSIRRDGRLRSRLAALWRLVRPDRTLRCFMLVNTARETTFAGMVALWAAAIYGIGLLAAGFATQWQSWFYGVVAVVALAGGAVMTLAWGLLLGIMPGRDQGAVSGLAVTTRGIGLLLGPPAVGIAVDVFQPFLDATDGYAAVWSHGRDPGADHPSPRRPPREGRPRRRPSAM